MGLEVISLTPSGAGAVFGVPQSSRLLVERAGDATPPRSSSAPRRLPMPWRAPPLNPPPHAHLPTTHAGTPPLSRGPWTDRVEWVRGSALEPRTYQHLLPGAMAAISCVGGFGSTQQMLQVNGAANAAAIAAARASGVPRFAYVSAHIPAVPGFEYLMEGYVKGKRQAEEELARQYPDGAGSMAVASAGRRAHACRAAQRQWQRPRGASGGHPTGAGCRELSAAAARARPGACPPRLCCLRRPCTLRALRPHPQTSAGGVALRPWIIYGDRAVSNTIKLPLGALFGPVEALLRRVPNARALADTPLAGPLFLPPVSVQAVARAALAAATDDTVPSGVMDVWAIEKYS
jgi:hypothetical protein